MDGELAEKKVEALLHDPPGKAPVLWYRSHEAFSAELVQIVLGRPPRYEDLIKQADQYAAAVDRAALVKAEERARADFLDNPQLVHTLSGQRYQLETLRRESLSRIESVQREALEVLLSDVPDDPVTRYWYVWRGYQAALVRVDERVGKLWSYLPADTRIPDHSIWDHMRLTSAFAGALPDPALLVFSLGPVQRFIQGARKTADLWAGSFLLSWLAWRAMQPVVDELGADAILFPDLSGQPFLDTWLREEKGLGNAGWLEDPRPVASLPNRFVALVPWELAGRLGRAAEEAVHGALREFVSEVLQDGASTSVSGAEAVVFPAWGAARWLDGADLEQLSQQVASEASKSVRDQLGRLEGSKVYPPNRGTYYSVQSLIAETSHGWAKAVRRFAQIDERGRRCTLCGVREQSREATQRVPTRPGEALCWVCAARRKAARSSWVQTWAGERVSMTSTHNVAAVRFYEAVVREVKSNTQKGARLRDAIERLRRACGDHVGTAFAPDRLWREAQGDALLDWFAKLPAELLDPETLRRAAEDDLEELGIARDAAPAIYEGVRKLLKTAKDMGLPPPARYFAILMMDGDHMGQWLSGRLGPQVRDILHTAHLEGANPEALDCIRPLSTAHQGAVTRALNAFSTQIVPVVIEEIYGGVLVYSGGDDVLALLPLGSLFDCIRDLRALFRGQALPPGSETAKRFRARNGFVEDKRRRALHISMGGDATCSFGVAIVHQKWPLRDGLARAREMESDYAKKSLKRNAVAIALVKRSGGYEWYGGQWDDGAGEGGDPLSAVALLAELLGKGQLGRRFAYAVREEAPLLLGVPEAAEGRIRWLARRHRPRSGDSGARADGGEWIATLGAEWAGLGRRLAVKHEFKDAVERFRAAAGLAEFVNRAARGWSE